MSDDELTPEQQALRPARTTPNMGLPVPGDADPADGPDGIGDLADAIDALAAGHVVSTGQFFSSGDLKMSAAAVPPSGWLLCDGQAVSRSTYASLFTAIGTSYGVGDGTNTFNVPDYRGRNIIGAGAGPGLTARALGDKGGEERHLIVIGEVPSHNHGGATGTGTTGNDNTDHTHAGTTNAADRSLDHLHASPSLGAFVAADGSLGLGNWASGTGHTPAHVSNQVARVGTTAAADRSLDHLHSFSTGGRSAYHAHSVPALAIAAQGGGAPINVMAPYGTANVFIKA